MSVVKLEKKVQQYAEDDLVSLTVSSFSKLCRNARKAFNDPEPSTEEKDVTAKLFYIIGRQGKSSAATALFRNKSQLEDLFLVSWSDIDWYANHPNRSSISGMYSELGFPNREVVTAFETWVNNNAAVAERGKFFSSLTGMQNGRGAPKEAELNSLKKWSEKQSGQSGSWRDILVSISSKQIGIPAECFI